MEHKDDEIRILREKLDDATVTNAKTRWISSLSCYMKKNRKHFFFSRSELLRLQQETDGWDLRRNELERDLEATRNELSEERSLRRREQEFRESARTETAELEYERDRLVDELQSARLKIGKEIEN